MELTEKNVLDTIMNSCYKDKSEALDNAVIVTGTFRNDKVEIYYNPDRIDEHRDEIASLLDQMGHEISQPGDGVPIPMPLLSFKKHAEERWTTNLRIVFLFSLLCEAAGFLTRDDMGRWNILQSMAYMSRYGDDTPYLLNKTA